LNYLLSFVVIAIFWVNHRSMLGLVRHVNASVLWANNALLFWMSLIPWATAYMGQTNAAPLAVAAYGALMAISAFSFGLLRVAIAAQHRTEKDVSERHKKLHLKDSFGILLYALSVPLAFVSVRGSFFIFMLIPVLYFLPEKLTEP
jgi:uncharacterized membrane protein